MPYRLAAALAAIVVLWATGCGGDEQQASQPPPRTAVAEDTDRDGVPDSRDAAPYVALIQTREDQARADRQTRRSEREREEQNAAEDAEQNRADREKQRAQAFFSRMDDDAVALDDAVGRALQGDDSARPAIARLRRQILNRVNTAVLRGDDPSIGANLLLSAATTARSALNAGNVRRLVESRDLIREARDKLASEVIGP